MTSPLENVVVVLNEPQDVVNIAGTARAMMNTGLRRLRLVRPAEYDEWRIEGIAHNTRPLLDRIEFFDTLAEATADATHVAGTTARSREATFVWHYPRQAAPELLAAATAGAGPVALVFGREDKGLSNSDLDRCDRILTIPVDPRYPSLNLAQAVLLVGYELWHAAADEAPLPTPKRTAGRASSGQLQEMFTDVEATLERIEFFKTRGPAPVMRTVRAIARRAGLNAREAKLVRAIAIEVRKYLDRKLAG
jgi:tRNA/rRNA methyltransferase